MNGGGNFQQRPPGPGMGGMPPGMQGGPGGPRPMGNPNIPGGAPYRPPNAGPGGVPPGGNNTGNLFGDDPLKGSGGVKK